MKTISGSMVAMVLLAGSCLAQGGAPAPASADEGADAAALEACEGYATAQFQKALPGKFVKIVLSEEDFKEEPSAGKVGSQALGTTVTGEAAWKEKTGAPSTVRYLCLLDPAKAPIYFGLADVQPRDPVQVCWDDFEPAGWEKITRCLEGALKREEAALAEQLKETTAQAAQSMDKLSAAKTLKESNAQWIKYRDTECARRDAAVAGRNHPDLGELTCRIDKTMQRIEDLQFDE